MPESRGDRLRLVREALGLKQDEMALRLQAASDARGFEERYSASEVSRLEKGRSPISVDDLILYAEMDPEHRGIGWLATGTREVAAFPVSPTAQRSGRPATARELGLEAPARARKKAR